MGNGRGFIEVWNHFPFRAYNGVDFGRVLNDRYEECSNQRPMSLPMLPLILVCSAFLERHNQKMLGMTAPDKHSKVYEAFVKLMDGVEQNLEPESRDKLTQNMAVFMQACISAHLELVRISGGEPCTSLVLLLFL